MRVSLARGLSFFVFDFLKIRRKLVLQNLRVVYTEKTEAELLQIAKESVFHFVLTVIEFLSERHGQLSKNIEIKNPEIIEQALNKGRGVIVLCIHMGSWEAMGAFMTKRFCPSYVVVKKVGSEALNLFVHEFRQKNGFYSILKRKKGEGFAQIKDVLDKGQIVGLVMDQSRPNSPRLPFFGKQAKTNTSIAAIWHKLRPEIVPAYITRRAYGVHTVHVLPAVNPSLSGDDAQDILNISSEFNKITEQMILACPEQYFWYHNRWK